ncbi:hypothetical protein GW17_00038043 [Ensete ventricosum]|nr:hypothetical protein GW17_00038043 [Ensete ventricosum]
MSNRRLLVSAIRWISFQKAHLQAHGDGKNKEHPAHAQVPAFSEWVSHKKILNWHAMRNYNEQLEFGSGEKGPGSGWRGRLLE